MCKDSVITIKYFLQKAAFVNRPNSPKSVGRYFVEPLDNFANPLNKKAVMQFLNYITA